MTPAVYLAGAYSRRVEIAEYARALELVGYTVTSRWLDGTHDYDGTEDAYGKHLKRAAWARIDLDDIDRAQMVVVFGETGPTPRGRGGRHVEYGYALARGKTLFVIGNRDNIFHDLPEAHYMPDWDTFLHGAAARVGWFVERARAQ